MTKYRVTVIYESGRQEIHRNLTERDARALELRLNSLATVKKIKKEKV